MSDIYIVGMIQTYNELSLPLQKQNYCINLLKSSIDHYTKLCNHLIILDDCSTDNTYNILMDLEHKFPNRYTLIKSNFTLHDIGAEEQNKKMMHSYAGGYRPHLICDFKINERYCNNIKYETFESLYLLLQSTEMKAVAFQVDNKFIPKIWIHESIYYPENIDGPIAGDFFVDNPKSDIVLPESIKEYNTLKIDIPIYKI